MTTVAPRLMAPIEDGFVRLARWTSWIYFFLLVFEGSLRKWVFPQFSAPLLIVRDPVVLVAYAAAFFGGFFPKGAFIRSCFVLAGLALLLSLFGRGNFATTLYGFHASFFHLPMIFLIAKVLTPSDVKRLGYGILFLAVPTILLMIFQFLAPPDSPLNQGTLGAESLQIGSALGRIRPAAFYSFNTGAGQYLALLAAISFAGLLTRKFRLPVAYVGGVCVLLGVAVSGSRTTVTSILVVLGSVVVLWMLRPKAVGRIPAILICLATVGLVAQRFAVFHQGLEVLQTRSDEAFENEPLAVRLVYNFVPSAFPPMLGYGLGVGTNVGAAVLTGEMTFLLAEAEWPRILMESGPLVGGAVIFWRLALIVYLTKRAYRCLRAGDYLPWLLNSVAAPLLFTSNFGQASTLGFAVFTSGLCLASMNPEFAALTPDRTSLPPPAPPRIRGRSVMAERLYNDVP